MCSRASCVSRACSSDHGMKSPERFLSYPLALGGISETHATLYLLGVASNNLARSKKHV
jgi:hypothetical protein